MANKPATKKDHTDVGGVAVPNDMIKEPGTAVVPVKKETALAVNDEQMIAEIKQLSGSNDNAVKEFPMLKLQHTTTPDGEPNPLRGHFTLVRKNDLGEWVTEDLGETIKFNFLLRRHFLKMVKGDEIYTSGDFDEPMEIVPLWVRSGDQSKIFAEGTPHSLQSRFLKKETVNGVERVRSELPILSKLYVMINGEVAVWKLSFSGTITWSKYTKLVPFAAGVVTLAGRTEEKKGSNKYYAPVFKAAERLTDLAEIKTNIELLRDMLPKRNQDNFVIEDKTNDVPFN